MSRGFILNNIIYADFDNKKENENYSADVYSYDMKKYQFKTVAGSIEDAYYNFVRDAFDSGVSVIQCIAIYSGLKIERGLRQGPTKVWKQESPQASNLVEY